MDKTKRKKSHIKSIIAEIAHDLKLKKPLVREVLLLTFKEIAIMLILKGKPVMIRRFIKFVIAVKGLEKIKESLKDIKTKTK